MSQSDWSVRLAQPEDAPSFTAVEEDAAQLLINEPSLSRIPAPPSSEPEAYRELIQKGHCLAAVSEGQIVGIAAARPIGRELHLHELSVASRFQRKGIGATLLNGVKVDARNVGFRAITLHTYRDIPWNAPFYQRHGFMVLDDLAPHPRLAAGLEAAVEFGLPRDRRCAMIHFLD